MMLLIAGLVGTCLLGAVALHHSKTPRLRRRKSRPKDSPTLALVKQRHALRKQLRKIVGDEYDATQLLQDEALRLGLAQSSIEALKAAIVRATAEKDADSQQLN